MKIKILNKNNLKEENLSISEKYDLTNLKEYETVDGEVYRKNFNETLDSATILIDNLPENERLDIEPYDEVVLDDTYSGKVVSPFTNKTHRMLVDDFRETMVSVYPKIYKYEISLFSKTKLLEGAICPNLSITPLRVGTKRSIYFYINEYMNLYCPKKRVKDGSDYIVEPIISISQNIATKFSDDCPELQWNTPTLREVLNDLFILKDCVPIVNANNELDFLDLTKTNRNISELNTINYIERSQSSKDYVSEIYMNMVNVMNTSVPNVRNTVNTSEFIPFNATNYVATSENIILKTKYPIQNIKHLYMVFIGGIYDGNVTELTDASYPVLNKVDLTNLTYDKKDLNGGSSQIIYDSNFVKEKNEYDSLKIAYRINDIEDNLDQYQNCCLYYTRYGNEIRGFSNQTKNTPFLFFDTGINSTLELLKRISTYQSKENSNIGNLFSLGNDSSIGVSRKNGTYYATFFQVEYETIADAVFKASKTNQPSNSRTIIDNQSYSFVDAYSQGFMEYQKVNRLGNQVLMINQRLDTSTNGTLIDIGDYYIENGEKFIVYSVEYQNHRHHIEVNAQATKDYILRNYFTGVKQKIRTWVNAQEEAHIRNEHTKIQIQLNKDDNGNEVVSKFGWDKFFSKSILMSSIKSSYPTKFSILSKTDKDLLIGDQRFYLDCVARVVGNSILITTGYHDNYLVGKNVDWGTIKESFDMASGGISYPSLESYSDNETIGGIALQNNYYVDQNGEFENITFSIKSTPTDITNKVDSIPNAYISSKNGAERIIKFYTDIYDENPLVFTEALTEAINNNRASVWIGGIEFPLKMRGATNPTNPSQATYYTYAGTGEVGDTVTVFPVSIWSSEFEKTLTYAVVRDFIRNNCNFPITYINKYPLEYALLQSSLLKDNKDIYRQNIQVEFTSGTNDIYFTTKFVGRNSLVSSSNTSRIKIFYSDTYIKGSLDLPSSRTLDTSATLTVNENGQISLRNIPSGKAYYITDASDNVILATNGITNFYVNIRCILNDNIYNEYGIIIDKL